VIIGVIIVKRKDHQDLITVMSKDHQDVMTEIIVTEIFPKGDLPKTGEEIMSVRVHILKNVNKTVAVDISKEKVMAMKIVNRQEKIMTDRNATTIQIKTTNSSRVRRDRLITRLHSATIQNHASAYHPQEV